MIRYVSFRSRLFLLLLAAVVLSSMVLAPIAWHDTTRDPIVRRTEVELPGMPEDAGPVRIAFLSDIHVSAFDMPPTRLARIVRQVNALHPDVVLIGGDMLSQYFLAPRRYSAEQAIAPLEGLSAPLGVFAVPGNHDYTTDMPGLARAMRRHHVKLLVDSVVQAGPLLIGGLDDLRFGRVDLAGVARRMSAVPGGRIILTHEPDVFPQVPRGIGLTLAGHTHCGQAVLPWGYAPITMSRYGQRYACGRVDEDGKVLVTTAGLGTSGVPVRLFAPPDLWLITARPPNPMRPGGR